MDKIIMKNMVFHGYHGVLEEENILGQRFIVTAELYSDLSKAGVTDDVMDTINYAEVYDSIRAIAENKTFNLLEALAESMANEVLTRYQTVSEVLIKIKKPGAPVKGIFDYFGVEIRRRRNE